MAIPVVALNGQSVQPLELEYIDDLIRVVTMRLPGRLNAAPGQQVSVAGDVYGITQVKIYVREGETAIVASASIDPVHAVRAVQNAAKSQIAALVHRDTLLSGIAGKIGGADAYAEVCLNDIGANEQLPAVINALQRNLLRPIFYIAPTGEVEVTLRTLWQPNNQRAQAVAVAGSPVVVVNGNPDISDDPATINQTNATSAFLAADSIYSTMNAIIDAANEPLATAKSTLAIAGTVGVSVASVPADLSALNTTQANALAAARDGILQLAAGLLPLSDTDGRNALWLALRTLLYQYGGEFGANYISAVNSLPSVAPPSTSDTLMAIYALAAINDYDFRPAIATVTTANNLAIIGIIDNDNNALRPYGIQTSTVVLFAASFQFPNSALRQSIIATYRHGKVTKEFPSGVAAAGATAIPGIQHSLRMAVLRVAQAQVLRAIKAVTAQLAIQSEVYRYQRIDADLSIPQGYKTWLATSSKIRWHKDGGAESNVDVALLPNTAVTAPLDGIKEYDSVNIIPARVEVTKTGQVFQQRSALVDDSGVAVPHTTDLTARGLYIDNANRRYYVARRGVPAGSLQAERLRTGVNVATDDFIYVYDAGNNRPSHVHTSDSRGNSVRDALRAKLNINDAAAANPYNARYIIVGNGSATRLLAACAGILYQPNRYGYDVIAVSYCDLQADGALGVWATAAPPSLSAGDLSGQTGRRRRWATDGILPARSTLTADPVIAPALLPWPGSTARCWLRSWNPIWLPLAYDFTAGTADLSDAVVSFGDITTDHRLPADWVQSDSNGNAVRSMPLARRAADGYTYALSSQGTLLRLTGLLPQFERIADTGILNAETLIDDGEGLSAVGGQDNALWEIRFHQTTATAPVRFI